MAEPLAEAIVCACEDAEFDIEGAALGFGGTHYCAAFDFEKLPFALSHIASKHALDFVDWTMVKQAMEKTAEEVECAFVDWKGCTKRQKDKLIPALEENGLKWEKV